MKRVVLHGRYHNKDDKVEIMYKHYSVMFIHNVSDNYNTDNVDEMIKKVINDNRKVARETVIEFFEQQ